MLLFPLPVSGCGSSPAGEGGRPCSSSRSSLPLPVSGLGSSPAGEGGRPITPDVYFEAPPPSTEYLRPGHDMKHKHYASDVLSNDLSRPIN